MSLRQLSHYGNTPRRGKSRSDMIVEKKGGREAGRAIRLSGYVRSSPLAIL